MLVELIREVDDDKDDKISLKQFVTMLRRRYKGALLQESPGAVNIFDPSINVREFGVDVAKQYFDAKVRFNNNQYAYDDVQGERSKSAARRVQKSQRRANFVANFNLFEECANRIIFRCRSCTLSLYKNSRKVVFAHTVWYHEYCSAHMIQNLYRQVKARRTLLNLRIAKFKQKYVDLRIYVIMLALTPTRFSFWLGLIYERNSQKGNARELFRSQKIAQ